MANGFDQKGIIVKGQYDLAATLTIPASDKEKLPAVVLVCGTGKADRDGNMKGFQSNIYKDLAEYLTSLGFITLRYDKRGVAGSKGDFHNTGMQELVDDIISCVEYLEQLPNVDKIVLLGHSEGCELTTLASTKHQVSGLLLIAGAGIAIRSAMEQQSHVVLEEIRTMKGIKGILLRLFLKEKQIVGKQQKLFETVLATDKDVIRVQLMKFPAKWLRQHLAYRNEDILGILSATQCPVLAVTGDKDVQADANDLKTVQALAKSNITCTVIRNMDHLLREFFGEKSIMNIKKQYKREMGQPIHGRLKEEIKAWCSKNFIE